MTSKGCDGDSTCEGNAKRAGEGGSPVRVRRNGRSLPSRALKRCEKHQVGGDAVPALQANV